MLEELSDLGIATPVVRIGWPDQFIEHGKMEALRAKYGISVESGDGETASGVRTGGYGREGRQCCESPEGLNDLRLRR